MIALAVVALAVAVGSALLSPLAPGPLSALAFAGVVAASAFAVVELLWPERRPCSCECHAPRVETLTVGRITAGAVNADLQVRAVPAPIAAADDDATGPLPVVRPRPYAPPVHADGA